MRAKFLALESYVQWTLSHQLLHNRSSHTSWSVDGQVYIVGGGYDSDPTSRLTTEILTPESSTTLEGFQLKYETW